MLTLNARIDAASHVHDILLLPWDRRARRRHGRHPARRSMWTAHEGDGPCMLPFGGLPLGFGRPGTILQRRRHNKTMQG